MFKVDTFRRLGKCWRVTSHETRITIMSNRKCGSCGNQIGQDEGYWAEGYKRDVCNECFYDIVKTCQLCGKDDVMPSEVSHFILCKAELSQTCRVSRPPGIFRVIRYPFLTIPMIGGGSMDGNDVLFVDKLPKFDRNYEISGHICTACSKPYAEKCASVYGVKPQRYTSKGWSKELWATEREHTRSTILANPDMLRDLECDSYKFDPRTRKPIEHAWTDRWDELREAYLLPNDLPTFHEWVVLDYKGVKVYGTGDYENSGAGWLVLKPEPHYRRYAYCGGHRDPGVLFCASSLPTFKRHKDDGKYHDHYYWNKIQSIPAIKKAIALGLIRQDGTFDAKGKPCVYG